MSGIANTKLCQLLETLSSKEMSSFSDFVASPLYNKNKGIFQLTKELVKAHPNFEKVSKEKLEQKLKSTTLVKDMSAILKLAERFLTIFHLENNKALSDFVKVQELNKRVASKALQTSIKNFKSDLEASKIRSFNELLYDFLVEEEADNAYCKDVTLPYEESLKNKSATLDVFYVFNKLKIYTEMQLRERVMNVSYEKTFFKEIEIFMENKPELFKPYPSIQTYLTLVNLQKDNVSKEEYEKYFNSLKNTIPVTSKGEASNFIQHAINHCINMLNTGKDYLSELFNAMKFQVEEGLLVVDGFVHDRSYKNIIEVAIRKEEYDWAEQFLDSHIKYISTEDRSMVYDYNQANILVAKQDYKGALRKLTFANFKNVFYQIATKTLLIKIYFETNDSLSVESSVNNYKAFLKREKQLANLQREMYNNFLKFVLALMRIKDKANNYSADEKANKVEKLNKEIGAESSLADKTWLLKQLKSI